MKPTTAATTLALFTLLLIGGWWYYRGAAVGVTQNSEPSLTQAAFACAGGTSIGATFYKNKVAITLSDGRSFELPQTMSASGIRYATSGEAFVFWGKGNTAFVVEGARARETYSGCIVVAPDPTKTLTQIFASSTVGISFRFPEGYTFDPAHVYRALGPGKEIGGVKITVPAQAVAGSNLSSDTYVSIEKVEGEAKCSASLFLPNAGEEITFRDSGVEYSVATTTGVAAGNIYDEAVFALPDSRPCRAVRYFIHSTNIGNYPPGAVREFDKAGVIDEFDRIRRSLVLAQ